MSDETNGNGSSNRLDRIEELLEKFATLTMRNEFNLAAYRKANDERINESEARSAEHFARMEALQANTQKHLDHITQLVRIFGNRSFQFEEVLGKVHEATKPRPSDETA